MVYQSLLYHSRYGLGPFRRCFEASKSPFRGSQATRTLPFLVAIRSRGTYDRSGLGSRRTLSRRMLPSPGVIRLGWTPRRRTRGRYSILLEEVAARGLVRHTSAKFSPQNTAFFGKNKASVLRPRLACAFFASPDRIFPKNGPFSPQKSGPGAPFLARKSTKISGKFRENRENRGCPRDARFGPPENPPKKCALFFHDFPSPCTRGAP